MDLTGYRAFLLGTARDQMPVRGIWLTVQRRDDVEGAADQRAFALPPGITGVSKVNHGKVTRRTAQ